MHPSNHKLLEKLDNNFDLIRSRQNIPVLTSTMASVGFLMSTKMSKITSKTKINKTADLVSSKTNLKSPKQKEIEKDSEEMLTAK